MVSPKHDEHDALGCVVRDLETSNSVCALLHLTMGCNLRVVLSE